MRFYNICIYHLFIVKSRDFFGGFELIVAQN